MTYFLIECLFLYISSSLILFGTQCLYSIRPAGICYTSNEHAFIDVIKRLCKII